MTTPSPGSLHRSHRRPRSPRPGASSPAQERSDAFARLAEHAAARKLTVEYRETGLEALPAIGDDFTAGRAQTKIIIKPNEATPS